VWSTVLDHLRSCVLPMVLELRHTNKPEISAVFEEWEFINGIVKWQNPDVSLEENENQDTDEDEYAGAELGEADADGAKITTIKLNAAK